MEAVSQNWDEQRQTWTLSGQVVIHYRDYVIRADNVTYNRATTELEADGHLQVTGGPNDLFITATHGDMRLNMHTARFYNVSGTQGVRAHRAHGRVFTTTTPLLFSGRVLLQTGEGRYRIVDGSITNCRLPHPDWRILARSIDLDNKNASTPTPISSFLAFRSSTSPICTTPPTRPDASADCSLRWSATVFHPRLHVRRTGLLGHQSQHGYGRRRGILPQRGWAPNGDFRYKGPGPRSPGRALECAPRPRHRRDRHQRAGPGYQPARQPGRHRCDRSGARISRPIRGSPAPRNIFPATSTAWSSTTTIRRPSARRWPATLCSRTTATAFFPRPPWTASSPLPAQAKATRSRSCACPSCVTTSSTARSPAPRSIGGLASSIGYLNRSEPLFHARNVGRLDFYPHLSMPIVAAGWSLLPKSRCATPPTPSAKRRRLPIPRRQPTISHEPLNRKDLEASLDLRPPAFERDFALPFWHRQLRHVDRAGAELPLCRRHRLAGPQRASVRYHRHRQQCQ